MLQMDGLGQLSFIKDLDPILCVGFEYSFQNINCFRFGRSPLAITPSMGGCGWARGRAGVSLVSFLLPGDLSAREAPPMAFHCKTDEVRPAEHTHR